MRAPCREAVNTKGARPYRSNTFSYGLLSTHTPTHPPRAKGESQASAESLLAAGWTKISRSIESNQRLNRVK